MKKLGKTKFQNHRKRKGLECFICCMAMSAAVSLASCSNNGAPDDGSVSNVSNSANVIQKPDWVYVPERIEIEDKRADYGAMRLNGDRVCYLTMNGDSEGETQKICQYSLVGRELKSIPIDWKDDGSIREISCYTFDENCNTWLVANVYSAGFSQFRRFLYKFDPEGKNLFFRDISEQLGSGTSVGGMAVDGKGRIYVFNPEAGICLYAEDGSYYGTIAYGSSENVQARGAVIGDDNRFYVCISKGKNADSCTLMEANFDKKQLTESIKDFPNVNGICADSTGQYDFLLYDNAAAYGYDLSTQKKEELFAWGDSDINGYFVKYLKPLGDGRYFCTVDDWAYDDRSVVLLTKTKAEEAPKRQNLVLATVDGGSDLTGMAVGFNRNNNQYHIAVKNYASLTDLYNDILAKEAIDLIDLSGVNVEKLSRQGIFEDLTPYLEQSETFERSDFLDGILDVYSFDGILVGIPENFTLRTVVGDKSQLGTEGGLTLDGLFTAAGRNPGALPFDGITKEEMMQYLCMFNEDVFINWETGECKFDSAQFKALLEFVNRFPDSIKSGEEETSLSDKVQNGEVMFAIANIKGLKKFRDYVKMFGENTECIGFPTADGQGGTILFPENAFGIAAASGNKDGAWQFIEGVLGQVNPDGMETRDVYLLYTMPDKFPARKEILDVMIEYRVEEDGEMVSEGLLPSVVYENGWKLTAQTITQDEINVVLDLIKEAEPFFSLENDKIIQIINEEAGAYYSGQKKIEDVMGLIQNRVKLYVNENQ